jgi:hypothetical protein
MAGKNDHLAALATPAKDLSEPGPKLAEVSVKLAASDPAPAKIPADAAAAVAATAQRLATALHAVH